MLVVGSSYSKKEQVLDSILISLMTEYTPSDIRFILYDDKSYLSPFADSPFLLTQILRDCEYEDSALTWSLQELDRRNSLFREEQVRNIDEYRQLENVEQLAEIVIVINGAEHRSKGFFNLLDSLVVKGPDAGIHLLLVTDRLSSQSMPQKILVNIPSRLVFQTIDIKASMLAGVIGAKTLSVCNFLFTKIPGKQIELQLKEYDTSEIKTIIADLRVKYPNEYFEQELILSKNYGIEIDPLFDEALKIVQETQVASASMLQRRLRLGYARAARMLDMMEELGHIGPSNGITPRTIEAKKNSKPINS